MVVDVPLVPGEGVREVAVGLESPPEGPAAHAHVEMHPLQRRGDAARGRQSEVKARESVLLHI